MNKRPGVTIKASTIPETISQLPKKMQTEPLFHFNIMLRGSMIKKLREATTESGYSQQEIIDKALEAFLK